MLNQKKRLKKKRGQEGVGPKALAVAAQVPIAGAAVAAAAAQPRVHLIAVARAAVAVLHILPPLKGKRGVVAVDHLLIKLGAAEVEAIHTETEERGVGVGAR